MTGYPRSRWLIARTYTAMGGKAPIIPGQSSRVVPARLPQSLADAVDEYLDESGLNRSTVVRAAIEAYLETHAPHVLKQPKLVA